MEATDGPNSFPTARRTDPHRPRGQSVRAPVRGDIRRYGGRDPSSSVARRARAPRASPWSRGGLARGSPVPHGIDWHGFVHVADVTYILTFGSLDSRRGSPPDLRSRVNLGISRRARMSGMSTAFKCRLKCTRRGWRSRPGVRPTGTGTRGPRVSVWISSRFARAESLLKWPK